MLTRLSLELDVIYKVASYVSADDRIMGPVRLSSGDLDPHSEAAIDDICCCQAGHRVRLCRGVGLDPWVPGTYERTRTADAGHNHPLRQRKRGGSIFETQGVIARIFYASILGT